MGPDDAQGAPQGSAEGEARRVRDLLDRLRVIVWEADAATFRFTFVSRAAVPLLGYPLAAWYEPGFWADHLHPDDRDEAVEVCLLATAAGEDHEIAYRMIAADGRIVALQDTVKVIRDCNGVVRGLEGVMVDVTEQRRMEANLARTELRYKQLFDNADEVILRVGLDGRILDANPKAEEAFGYHVKEMIGRHVLMLVAPQDRDFVLEQVRRKLAREVDRTVSAITCRRADGRWVPFEVSSTLVTDPDDSSWFYIAARDVSDRQAIEQQLQQVQKMEAVGRLSAGVAHDFNNVLAAIRVRAETALASTPSPQDRSAFEHIKSSADVALRITNHLLAFSRLQVLNPEPVDLNQLVENMAPLLEPMAGDAELRLELAPDVGMIRVDRGQLEQVIVNLVLNASDAVGRDGHITVETAEVNRPGADGHPVAWVMLAVADDGAGMDRETRERAFEPFFTTKQPGQGTGLGLATVHGIVGQSDGQVRIESAPGKGTRVEVHLPRARRNGGNGEARFGDRQETR